MLSVTKREVQMFTISRGDAMNYEGIELTKDEAHQAWRELGEALGIRALTQVDCGSHMAHDAHINESRRGSEVTYCSGRSRDMT